MIPQLASSIKSLCCGVLGIGLVSLTATSAYCQMDPPKNKYWFSSYEFIFSLSDIGAPDSLPQDLYSSSNMRFSGFINSQYQYHYDINRNFGLMTGFGFRNVGFINNIGDTIKLKQRVYSFGVPVAMKFGKLPGGYSVTLGVEPELFFHYKQKAIYDDEKYKKMGWFSNRVNLINPSVFVDFRFKNGFFLRYKHYLLDVLVPENQSVSVGEKSVVYVPETSKMYYLSFGFSLPIEDEKDDRKRPNNDIFGFMR
jgi:hypothetical protein